MIPKFPKNESILSWTNLSLTKTEQSWNYLISWFDDFVNSTMFGFEDKISMSYKNELFSSLILRMNKRFYLEDNLKKEICGSRFIFNSFSTICLFSISSFKSIFKNPSTELRRVTKLIPASKASRFTNKTTIWLAKRPGVTIQDKIAPKNNILTEITIFSKDTKENRETLYLFENLYWVLGSSVYNCNCLNCKSETCKNIKKNYELIKSLFSQRLMIKNDIFSDVKKEKQLIANNKLISDPDYKCILDSTKKFENYDATYKNKWDNLDFYIASLAKYLIASELLSFENTQIKDFYGSFNNQFNKIYFSRINEKESNIDDICIEYKKDDTIKKIIVSQENLDTYIDVNTFKKQGKRYIHTNKETTKYELADFLKNIENALIKRSVLIDTLYFINTISKYNENLKLLTFNEGANNENS